MGPGGNLRPLFFFKEKMLANMGVDGGYGSIACLLSQRISHLTSFKGKCTRSTLLREPLTLARNPAARMRCIGKLI